MISFISSISSFWVLIVLVVFVVLVCLFLYSRGARYIFMDRIWTMVHKNGFYDSVLQREHERQLDLERFRVMYGIRDMETLAEAQSAVAWAGRLSLSLRELGRAGRWVKWKEERVRKPGLTEAAIIGALCLAFSFTTAFPLVFTVNDEALVKFKSSETWAWLGNQKVKSFRLLNDAPWEISKEHCGNKEKIKNETPLSMDEIDYVCHEIGTEAYGEQITRAVLAQRLAGGFLLMWFCLFLWVVYRDLFALLRAFDLHKRVHGR